MAGNLQSTVVTTWLNVQSEDDENNTFSIAHDVVRTSAVLA